MAQALTVVLLGAVFGGLIQVVNADLDRRREGRAAGLIVFDSLPEVEFRDPDPPRIPVASLSNIFPELWENERKALARTMWPEDFLVISEAFAGLRRLTILVGEGEDPTEAMMRSDARIVWVCREAKDLAWKHSRTWTAMGKRHWLIWRWRRRQARLRKHPRTPS